MTADMSKYGLLWGYIASRGEEALRIGLAAEGVIVTISREGAPDGGAARAFYQKLGFVLGRLTVEFGSEVQEFVRRAPHID